MKKKLTLNCFCSVTNSCLTLCDPMDQASLSAISRNLLKLMFTESVMPSNHLIFCHPLLLLPSIFPSIISNESALHIRRPKYWSFSLSTSPSSEYSELISFRIHWFNLTIQEMLKSLPAPLIDSISSSELSSLYGPISHPYMTTGKTIALTQY